MWKDGMYLLGAICGSGRSMDRVAQSMDVRLSYSNTSCRNPWIAQGSCLRNLWIYKSLHYSNPPLVQTYKWTGW